MSGLVAGIGGKIAASLIFGRAKAVAAKGAGILSSIPKPVWEAIAVVGYVVALFALHQHYANAAIKAADAAGYERRASEDAAALIELRNRAATAEATGKAISQESRSRNDAQNADIHGTAGAIRMRGPGAAAADCRPVGNPAVPAASGGSLASGNAADAPGDQLPHQDGLADRAVVPWGWLVGRAEQADLDRAETLAWRDWYQRQASAWATLKGSK